MSWQSLMHTFGIVVPLTFAGAHVEANAQGIYDLLRKENPTLTREEYCARRDTHDVAKCRDRYLKAGFQPIGEAEAKIRGHHGMYSTPALELLQKNEIMVVCLDAVRLNDISPCVEMSRANGNR